jgi:hypothetical protein
MHLSLTRLVILQAEGKAAKPLTTQFVKRQPRLTKPLELKKRPQPKRRALQRKMVSVRARLERGEAQGRFEPTRVLGGLARPRADIGRTAGLASVEMEPASVAEAVEGARDVEQRIDMSLELLDIEALDTGKYHAMVVQDPTDKRNIQGFCHLAVVYTPAIHPAKYPEYERFIMPSFLNLAAAMDRYTDISTDVAGRITLNSAELMKTPWVYLVAFHGFVLSDAELQYLGVYMKTGGFVFGDGHNWPTWIAGYFSLKRTLLDALEAQGILCAYEPLPNDHPLYHCYFDFDSGPPAAADGSGAAAHVPGVDLIDHVDGLSVAGRLVALLTEKGYYAPWSPESGGGWTRQLHFGINSIVFALTQEGSITHRLMESVR